MSSLGALVILSMVSPVFEAMFSREFREEVVAKVQLPGKKADEMRDLLRQIYPNDRGEITMDNVEHLLKLADEYQIKVVLDCCKEFLIDKPYATKDIIIKALLLAQRYSMDEVRKHCYKLLRRMNLDELEELEGFENLDKDSTREILGSRLRDIESRLRDLENFLKEVYPQFAGIVDCARYLWAESGRPTPTCPSHYPISNLTPSESFRTRLDCYHCKRMLKEMTTHYKPCVKGQKSYPSYHTDMKFDAEIIDVLKNMFTLLNLRLRQMDR